MNLQEFLNSWFDSIDHLSDHDKGRKFIATKANGDEYFVKAHKKEEWGYFEWCTRKEHQIISDLGQKLTVVPENPLFFETDNHVILITTRYQNPRLNIYDLYTDQPALYSVIKDLNHIYRKLYNKSHDLGVSTRNMKQREQIDGYQKFKSTKEYILKDRIRSSASVGNKVYKKYEDEMKTCTEKLKIYYRQDRERFIHGDLQNPKNILFNKNGVFGILDWELAGWFDYLYDIAFIEATFIDQSCTYNHNYDANELRDILYTDLDITPQKKRIIDLYKIWPYYVELELLHKRDSIDTNQTTVQKEIQRQKKLLEDHIHQLNL